METKAAASLDTTIKRVALDMTPRELAGERCASKTRRGSHRTIPRRNEETNPDRSLEAVHGTTAGGLEADSQKESK